MTKNIYFHNKKALPGTETTKVKNISNKDESFNISTDESSNNVSTLKIATTAVSTNTTTNTIVPIEKTKNFFYGKPLCSFSILERTSIRHPTITKEEILMKKAIRENEENERRDLMMSNTFHTSPTVQQDQPLVYNSYTSFRAYNNNYSLQALYKNSTCPVLRNNNNSYTAPNNHNNDISTVTYSDKKDNYFNDHGFISNHNLVANINHPDDVREANTRVFREDFSINNTTHGNNLVAGPKDNIQEKQKCSNTTTTTTTDENNDSNSYNDGETSKIQTIKPQTKTENLMEIDRVISEVVDMMSKENSGDEVCADVKDTVEGDDKDSGEGGDFCGNKNNGAEDVDKRGSIIVNDNSENNNYNDDNINNNDGDNNNDNSSINKTHDVNKDNDEVASKKHKNKDIKKIDKEIKNNSEHTLNFGENIRTNNKGKVNNEIENENTAIMEGDGVIEFGESDETKIVHDGNNEDEIKGEKAFADKMVSNDENKIGKNVEIGNMNKIKINNGIENKLKIENNDETVENAKIKLINRGIGNLIEGNNTISTIVDRNNETKHDNSSNNNNNNKMLNNKKINNDNTDDTNNIIDRTSGINNYEISGDNNDKIDDTNNTNAKINDNNINIDDTNNNDDKTNDINDNNINTDNINNKDKTDNINDNINIDDINDPDDTLEVTNNKKRIIQTNNNNNRKEKQANIINNNIEIQANNNEKIEVYDNNKSKKIEGNNHKNNEIEDKNFNEKIKKYNKKTNKNNNNNEELKNITDETTININNSNREIENNNNFKNDEIGDNTGNNEKIGNKKYIEIKDNHNSNNKIENNNKKKEETNNQTTTTITLQNSIECEKLENFKENNNDEVQNLCERISIGKFSNKEEFLTKNELNICGFSGSNKDSPVIKVLNGVETVEMTKKLKENIEDLYTKDIGKINSMEITNDLNTIEFIKSEMKNNKNISHTKIIMENSDQSTVIITKKSELLTFDDKINVIAEKSSEKRKTKRDLDTVVKRAKIRKDNLKGLNDNIEETINLTRGKYTDNTSEKESLRDDYLKATNNYKDKRDETLQKNYNMQDKDNYLKENTDNISRKGYNSMQIISNANDASTFVPNNLDDPSLQLITTSQSSLYCNNTTTNCYGGDFAGCDGINNSVDCYGDNGGVCNDEDIGFFGGNTIIDCDGKNAGGCDSGGIMVGFNGGEANDFNGDNSERLNSEDGNRINVYDNDSLKSDEFEEYKSNKNKNNKNKNKIDFYNDSSVPDVDDRVFTEERKGFYDNNNGIMRDEVFGERLDKYNGEENDKMNEGYREKYCVKGFDEEKKGRAQKGLWSVDGVGGGNMDVVWGGGVDGVEGGCENFLDGDAVPSMSPRHILRNGGGVGFRDMEVRELNSIKSDKEEKYLKSSLGNDANDKHKVIQTDTNKQTNDYINTHTHTKKNIATNTAEIQKNMEKYMENRLYNKPSLKHTNSDIDSICASMEEAMQRETLEKFRTFLLKGELLLSFFIVRACSSNHVPVY